MTTVAVDQQATDRLDELGLTADQVSRVVLRADAEAKLSNDLEPPNAEGMTRYIKTNRFLREELLPHLWDYDNSQNYCRTIHPSGEFAIVASSGDEYTGVWIPGQSPSTKYRKGETTVRAVEANLQLSFELGEAFDEEEPRELPEKIWYLLYRVTADQIFVELSFPTAIDGGVIADWKERIILPPVSREETPLVVDPPADEGGYSVDVALR